MVSYASQAKQWLQWRYYLSLDLSQVLVQIRLVVVDYKHQSKHHYIIVVFEHVRYEQVLLALDVLWYGHRVRIVLVLLFLISYSNIRSELVLQNGNKRDQYVIKKNNHTLRGSFTRFLLDAVRSDGIGRVTSFFLVRYRFWMNPVTVVHITRQIILYRWVWSFHRCIAV